MSEFPFKLSEIKLALKRKGLNYKLNHYEPEDGGQGTLTFLDVARGTTLRGKIVRSFNEGEGYHWPQLNHENIALLLDVLSVRDGLNVFLTTDLRKKLRNIIHEEDFVYDSKCFDRKRTYARGIFSGLSYLHGKSLCLMNLGDENIFICSVYDRAVIANFSSLACSEKITRSELKVNELYRAPETEKGEFDAMAAEIWAGGTLMMDVFLAHTVPWAVINYKPQRILEIVDKLSMELFQAANAGSVVTTIDLARFKAFLRSFFRENPCMRITARYASIASFLKPKFKSSTARMSITRISCSHINCRDKKHFISRDCSELPSFSPCQTNDSVTSKQCKRFKYFDLEPESPDIIVEWKTPKWLVPYSKVFPPNGSGADERICQSSDTKNPSQNSTLLSNKGENIKNMDIQMGGENKTFDKLEQLTKPNDVYSENDNRTSEMFSRQKEISQSCKLMAHGMNASSKSSYRCSQSKSLSFIKPTADDIKNEISFRLSCSRNCSHSSIKSLPPKQQTSWQESDFCLDRLFEEKESTEEIMIGEEEVTQKTSVGSDTRYKKHFQNVENVPLDGTFKRAVRDTGLHRKETKRDLCNQSDIQRITKTILLLRKCQTSLQDHLRMFSNEEFVQKQRNLINEYQLLLRQERIRLYEILRNKYALHLDEIIKIIHPKSMNSRSRYRRTYSKLQSNQRPRDSSYGLAVFKSAKYVGHSDAGVQKYRDIGAAAVPSRRFESTFSYRKANEKSEAERDQIPFGTENRSEDKLIVKETKSGVEDDSKAEAIETASKHQVPNTKADASKNSTKAKKKMKNASRPIYDHRHNESRRSFFFSLCPGGKVEEPASSVKDERSIKTFE